MPSSEESVRALREAVRQAPDSVALRRQLADALSRCGRWAEAEKEYRLALPLAGTDSHLKVCLAEAFFRQAKHSQALVVVEDLLKHPETPATAYLLHAHLLLHRGELDRAVHQYRYAVDTDPSLADASLAEQLGLEGDVTTSPVPRRHRPSRPEAKAERPAIPVDRPTLTFASVGGMEPLKDEIRLKIIHPVTHAHLYAAYGKKVGGGILLYGPPGCGKTYLARATAGEVKASFLPVGINDVLDMWVGRSERNLHDIFASARANRPCVLFFDEVDALGGNRTELRSSGQRPLINQFLAEMDGVEEVNQGVLILAATNAPWHLDPAFRRPDRFDRILFVPPPDTDARAEILRLLCQGKPLDGLDYDLLSRKTEGFSGADLKAVVDLAVEKKLREAIKVGVPRPLTTRDLSTAAAGLKPSTREWFATARSYALYANQGGLYDDVLKFLKL